MLGFSVPDSGLYEVGCCSFSGEWMGSSAIVLNASNGCHFGETRHTHATMVDSTLSRH